MPNKIEYNGADKWKRKATELLNEGGGSGLVDDVTVNGTSVVTNKVAEIDLTPYALKTDIQTNYYNKTDIDTALASIYTKTEVNNLLADKQDSFIGGTISSGDLNTYTTIGHYYVNSTGASSVSHLPVALAGYLEVIQPSATSSGSRLQRYTAISSNTVVRVYERNYNSGAWQTWKQIGEDVYLPLTGGTLTGDLEVVSDNLQVTDSVPYIRVKNTGVTVDNSANNGLSASQYSYVVMNDDSDYYMSRMYTEANSSGEIITRLQTRNMMTSGTRRTSTIRVSVDKSGNTEFATGIGGGTATYTIATPANFRSAIGINDSPTILAPSITASQSVATATYKSLGSFELAAGTWLISYKAQFAANASGLRRIMLTSTENGNSAWADSRITSHAASNQIIEIGWTTMAIMTSTATRYLTAYQNSGSDLSVTGYVKAIKIINI